MIRKCLFHCLIFASLIILCSSRYRNQYSAEPNACVQCMNNRTCLPPNCFCCRDELRLPISVRDIPQIVFFTFDDALTDSAAKFYHQLFNESRKNPNGCPISMTLFVSHHDTVYSNVNYMYRKGMEIAAHSVSHSHMSNENFMKEAQDQKRNIAKFGGVPENEVVGWRSPFLEPVGDMQPHTLKKLGYTYDATLTFSKRSLKDKAPTPFTLDFGWPYDCKVKPCPKHRHFGFWEVPVVSLLDYLHQYDCVYVDGCNNPPPDETSAYNFLMDNFNSYYSKYRVPFGINMHPSWFYIPERLNAMDRFIRKLANMDDVFIVSVKKMIDWLKNPTGLSQIHSFKPWQCANQQNPRIAHETRKNQNHNTRRRRPDSITRRQNNIQARLEKIQAMRKHSGQPQARDLKRLQQSTELRKKWWVRESVKHDSHARKHKKPDAIAPWVHRKYDRPVKQNARKPSMATSQSKSSKEVPFWKRKSKNISKDSTVKRNRKVAWWEKAIPHSKKAIPHSKTAKVQNVDKETSRSDKITNQNSKKNNFVNEKPRTDRFRDMKNTATKHFNRKEAEFQTKRKPLRNTFATKRVSFQRERPTQNIIRKTDGLLAPPKVDFKKQLKEQELKQLEIIEKQKKLQREQLRRQIEKLKENNKQVFKKQQEEETRRMNDIERKQLLALNQQKSLKLVQRSDQYIPDVQLTTVPPSNEHITNTIATQNDKYVLFPDKSSKLDPWTRFVQFIIRNKP